MKHFSVIDHFILSEQLFRQTVRCVNVLHDVDNLSDHDPLYMELNVAVTRFTLNDKLIILSQPGRKWLMLKWVLIRMYWSWSWIVFIFQSMLSCVLMWVVLTMIILRVLIIMSNASLRRVYVLLSALCLILGPAVTEAPFQAGLS